MVVVEGRGGGAVREIRRRGEGKAGGGVTALVSRGTDMDNPCECQREKKERRTRQKARPGAGGVMYGGYGVCALCDAKYNTPNVGNDRPMDQGG